MTFGIEDIQAVTFRCGECRTQLSFPRIRWANFPSNCPNCGVKWMNQPNPDNFMNDDPATTAFQAIRSFREALQALIGMGKTSAFAIALEIGEVTPEANGHSHQ